MGKVIKKVEIVQKLTPLPRNIRVGYQDIKVNCEGLGEAYGRYNNKNAVISYAPDQSDREMVNTILHEVLHAVLHNAALTEHPMFDHDTDEEILTTALANSLTQVFLDNPALLDWIKQNLHT